LTDIVITNEIIKINTKIYVIKNIKNVEYKEEEFSLMPVTAPMIVGLIVVVYFFQNIYTIGLLILLILLSIPKKTLYKTYINNELLKSTITFNKNDFLELKRKIEEALHNNNTESAKKDFEETVKRNKFQENLKKQEEKYKQRYKENTQVEKPIIKKEPMTYAEKKEKGDEYESKVAGYYKLDGYDIYLNGIRNNRKDGGIDVICRKDDEILLIQCKNWDSATGYKINHEKIKAFHSNCLKYIDENNLIKENTRLIYVVPDKKVFKNCAIEIFRDNYYNCRYEILKF
jgi:Holliday junction resolvase-like predicted endonuclease